ncbi:MAG: hypothetical protein ACREHC_08115 [Candidatus Levyibacteriota bacterium]
MIEPIKIDEAFDNWRYGLIASLVDRDDFLQDIKHKRTRYLYSNKPFDRTEVEKYLEIENKKLYGNEVYTPSEITIGGRRFAQSKYDFVALQLLKKYSRSYNFKNVISFAMSCGEVLEKDLKKSVPFLRVASLEQQEVQISLKQDQASIIFDPEANPEDIKKEVSNFFDRANKSELSQYIASSWIRKDTKSEIKRDRKWYWKYKKRNKSVMEIYDEISKSENIELKSVEKAIRTYKKLLEISLN